jgi:hypothetical protein
MPGRASPTNSRSGGRAVAPAPYKWHSPRAPAAVPVSVPVSVPVAPPSPVVVQQQQPGLFSNMWSGFGWGAGHSIAANIFRSPTQIVHTTAATPVPGTATAYPRIPTSKEYEQCMEESKQNREACKQYLEGTG